MQTMTALPPCEEPHSTSWSTFRCSKAGSWKLASLPTPTASAFPKALKGLGTETSLNTSYHVAEFGSRQGKGYMKNLRFYAKLPGRLASGGRPQALEIP